CNGGVRIMRKRTINPLGLQPLPLYFLTENTRGEKVTRACGIFFLLCSIEIGEVLPRNGGVRKIC
ncbi:MAG: hypothetical protein J6L03_05135, partial [Bacteroidaceae bacterium]|nr:hypothetical protein [Bacteroidaceae bacterium]